MTARREDAPTLDELLGPELEVTLTVNGATSTVRARAHHNLVEVLRDHLGLTGPREGCGVGMCGACTVLLDGKPVSGCLVLAPLAHGRDVRTVEGIERPGGGLDPVQQAFLELTAFQCSFCTPGFVLMVRGALDEDPHASDETLEEAVSGNLCRCGSYTRILEAARLARDRVAASSDGAGAVASPDGGA